MSGRDQALEAVVDFAFGRRCRDLAEPAVDCVARRGVDTMAGALGGLASTPSRVARAIAEESPVPGGCAVLGGTVGSTAEHATFANTVAVRYLDYNDHYPGSGHPSDMVPALFAAAELGRASGLEMVLAVDTAYEVATAIGDRHSLRTAGFDQGCHVAAGVAAGAGRLLGLGRLQLAHAVSIAVTSTMPMRSTRTGQLSDWKGCATAMATKDGLLAARLAGRGLTGPQAPFAGIDGLERHIPPTGPLRVGEPGADGLPAIQRTNCKLYPVEGNAQDLLHTVAVLREELAGRRVARIAVETFHRAWHEIGGGQGDRAQKWKPRTRETADHSLPYLVAVMLSDGEITPDSFTPERMADPALQSLMERTEVTEAPDLTALHPSVLCSRIAVTCADGSVIRRTTEAAPGSWRRPMSDAQLMAKYNAMGRRVGPVAVVDRILEALWQLPTADDVGDITALFPQVATS